MLEVYMELCIITFIGVWGLNFSNTTQIVSAVVTLISIVIIIFILIWIPIFAVKNMAKLRIMGKRFIHRWYAFFGDYKIQGFRTLFYTFFFVIR